jgi:hypothetical protein
MDRFLHCHQLLMDLGFPLTKDDSLCAIVSAGPASDRFCSIAASLVNGLLAKSVPSKRAADVSPAQFFQAAVVRPIRASGMLPLLDDPEFFAMFLVTCDGGGDLGGGRTILSAAAEDLCVPLFVTQPPPSSEDYQVNSPVICRLMIVEALAREVAANRLLEHRRLHGARARTRGPLSTSCKDSSSSSVPTTRKALDLLDQACRAALGASAAPMLVGAANTTVESVQRSLTEVAKKVSSLHLQPVIQSLSPTADAKLRLLFEVHMEEYSGRRAALIARLTATLETFCEAPEAKIERSALRLLCDECLRSLSAQPRLSLGHVYATPRLAVLAAFSKISATHRMVFPMRDVVIPRVPDRGGRVNTFSFDEKVATAVSNANKDHARKYAGGSGKGETGSKSLVPDSGRGDRDGRDKPIVDASQAAAPSSNAYVDPKAVRGGRGGRWSR